jgi:hypothetical protein
MRRGLLILLTCAACSSNGGDDDDDGTIPPGRDGGVVPAGDLSDEFDSAATISDWTLLHVATGAPARHSVLDIATTTPGSLTMVPTADNGWFEDDKGPFLFKSVTGDFVARTRVVAGRSGDPSQPPTQQFNSAGLLARNPASREGGGEDWLMYNVGFQDGRVGSEGKTTVDSGSTLFIVDGDHRAELVLCRVGSTFVMFRQNEGTTNLEETNRFDRADLPGTLQVGLIANGYGATPDLTATFEWVRFAVPSSEADCTAPIPAG